MPMQAIEIDNLSFSWPGGVQPVVKVERFVLEQGQRLFIHGPSGCGKSTFLQLLMGVLVPQKGRIHMAGKNIAALSAAARDAFRADNIGFILQSFNLLPYLSVMDNLLLPCYFSSLRRYRAETRWGSVRQAAEGLLAQLQLGEFAGQQAPVTALSVGQQQRVAVARALIGEPAFIIADEPTSALDDDNTGHFMALLHEIVVNSQATLVFVSHDGRLSREFERNLSFNALNLRAATC